MKIKGLKNPPTYTTLAYIQYVEVYIHLKIAAEMQEAADLRNYIFLFNSFFLNFLFLSFRSFTQLYVHLKLSLSGALGQLSLKPQVYC